MLGERGPSGLSTRSDQQPPRPEFEKEGLLDPVPAASEADLLHQQAHPDGHTTVFDTVKTMWANGLKSEACQHMLYSEFSYSDFVRFLSGLDEVEQQEVGELLDTMAPAAEQQARLGSSGDDIRADLEATGKAG